MMSLLRILNSKSGSRNSRSIWNAVSRGYHSYPSSEEVAQISAAKSSKEKLGVKKDDISLQKFDMNVMFPGVPISKGIAKSNPPTTGISLFSVPSTSETYTFDHNILLYHSI